MKNWQIELHPYGLRIKTLEAALNTNFVSPGCIPQAPWDSELTNLQSCLYKLLITYHISVWQRSLETVRAIEALWSNGYVASAAVLIRMQFELWCLSAYVTKALTEFNTESEFELFFSKVEKLFHGTRNNDVSVRGEASDLKSVNVLTLLKYMEDTDATSIYEMLCESAHPNNVRFTYLYLAGSQGDNWGNEVCKQGLTLLIEQKISSLERSINGVIENALIGTAKIESLWRKKWGEPENLAP